MDKLTMIAKVREHFSRPGAELIWDEKKSSCSYRQDNDPSSPGRCAIGVLIPDELYHPYIEGTGVRMLLEGVWGPASFNLAEILGEDTDVSFAEAMQRAHDNLAEVKDYWKAEGVAVDRTGVEEFLEWLDAAECLSKSKED